MAPEEARARLREGGLEAGILEEGIPCVSLPDGTNPASFLQGFPGIIQDPGAALVTVYADPPPGSRVVDLCAAPGGKALALGQSSRAVLAGDASLARMEILRENLERVGGRVDLLVADARTPPLARAEFVLLDVPCSGTGTLRRHPDARWRLTPLTLASLVRLQREILQASGALIPRGGHLVYATCTLEEEENQDQVKEFLRKKPGFRVEATGTAPSRFLTRDGYLQVLPQDAGFDGSFAARLVRDS
jgi:16S rRNA (cytosine967-C5)-methyltransferase